MAATDDNCQPLEELYRISEVARLTKLHRRTIERDIKSGRIESVPIGDRELRIPRREVERYLAGGR